MYIFKKEDFEGLDVIDPPTTNMLDATHVCTGKINLELYKIIGEHYNRLQMNTHTIYIPRLEVVWDDSVIASGSATGSSVEVTSSAVVSIKNLNPEYRTGTKAQFRIGTRPMWITKTFVTQSQYTIPYMLSTASYYSIRDARTDEVIISFGSGSRLSRDSNGSYFNLWFKGFQPERFYRVLVQATIGGTEQTFENVATFKVIR